MKKIKLLSLVSFCIFSWNVFGQVSGTVFRDFNANGTKDNTATFNEVGVGGVIITAFPSTGASQTTTSAIGTGAYSFTGLTLPVRLEFSGLNSGDYSSVVGAGNGSSVQFYSSPTTTANLGINYPMDYLANETPKVLTPVYIGGSRQSGGSFGNLNVFVSYPWDNIGQTTLPSNDANYSNLGAVWGTAIQRSTKKVFAAAFLKRHSSLGPNGLGAIYQLDYSGGGAPVITTLIDLKSAPFNLNLGTFNDSDVARNLSTTNPQSEDTEAFGKVAKIGLGNLTISDDQTTLYTINLFEKKLIKINIGNPVTTPSLGDVSEFSLPTPSCNLGTTRPFAVTFYKGLVYIGMVCSAENGGTVNDMVAHVYTFNPLTNSFLLAPGFPISLNYLKGPSHYNSTTMVSSGTEWNPWSDIATEHDEFLDAFIRHPTPVLSDIDFAAGGDMMVLGFMDRASHQWGYLNKRPDGVSGLYYYHSGGDILAVSNNSGTWMLENNGNVNGLTGCGVGNNEGPGGGEFFCQDTWGNDHHEISLGGNVINVARNTVKANVYDPITYDTGGTSDWSLNNGSETLDYQLYSTSDNPATFGKAAGLGELEILSDPAPIEIGNRVWMDTDIDGVQDADEMGLDNITVKLYNGTTLVATKITANGGQYYFGTADGVLPNTTYTIRIDAANFPTGKSITLKDRTTGGIQDLGDNDASLISSNAEITYTTGNAGENNHTLDFGFYACQPDSLKICAGQSAELVAPDGYTDYVWYIINAPNDTMQVATGQTFTTSTVGNYIYKAVDGAGCPVSLCCPVSVADSICLSCSSSVTATPGNCNSTNNQYDLSGLVTLIDPPLTGTLTVQIVGGISQTFSLPQSSPINYSFLGQVADGLSHSVIVTISGVTCSSSTTFNAPTGCLITCPSPNCASIKTKYIIKN